MKDEELEALLIGIFCGALIWAIIIAIVVLYFSYHSMKGGI
jgi:hypothetical protein